MFKYLVLLVIFIACTPESTRKSHDSLKDSTVKKVALNDSLPQKIILPKVNDSLENIARIIAGTWKDEGLFKEMGNSNNYKNFADNFSKRWIGFDTNRIVTLRNFQKKELSQLVNPTGTVFYPFSGPDFLYPGIFFPEAKKYILVGLEPVGTLPDFSLSSADSSSRYFSKINEALFAILRFSFFRTHSMRGDLKSGELDGTLHLLFLFLNRSGGSLVSVKPFSLDSSGNKVYQTGFEDMKNSKLLTKAIEIFFISAEGELKQLDYLSLDAVDYSLSKNHAFRSYMQKEQEFTTYLKGASYLLHKSYFSITRNIILNGSNAVVQDDSGIALNYFLSDSAKWSYHLFGQYSKPISTFSNRYQPKLDSLYKAIASKQLDFGIGYNYRDRNSNFMVAIKTNK